MNHLSLSLSFQQARIALPRPYSVKQLIIYVFSASFLMTCVIGAAYAQSSSHTTPASQVYGLQAVMKDLPQSWGLAYSPDNQLFITHRLGNFSILSLEQEDLQQVLMADISSQDEASALQTVNSPVISVRFLPDDLLVGGQGGLLDLSFHPDYLNNGWIYLSYSAGTEQSNALKVVRFKLVDNEVAQLEPVFEVANKKDTPVHYGGRLAFDSEHSLYITTGDGFDYREKAQLKHNQMGKTIRVTDTGEAHPANPFYNGPDAPESFVFSYGHRNPQGLVITDTDVVIGHEHGPAGGDEINFLHAGDNYGWPVITNGKDYIGATISPFTEYEGMKQPNLDWTPSIAPSGMVLYQGEKFDALKGHLLITSLKFLQIYAVPLFYDGDIGADIDANIDTNTDANNTEKIEPTLGKDFTILREPDTRLRDIESDPEGRIWVLGDGQPATLFMLVTLH
uniref:PQQ-dependent sugar dehydrogenase n=1 Tax=Ningiella ruwaisensis TaxID=2364274 RepID=UPI001446986B|nr:PQQ-dependent sugar dehydrogenase [Ningiella ruwaisensis]